MLHKSDWFSLRLEPRFLRCKCPNVWFEKTKANPSNRSLYVLVCTYAFSLMHNWKY